MRAPVVSAVCLALLLVLTAPVHAGEVHEAASQGDLKSLQQLLQDNPELVNAPDEHGYSPLHHATHGGHTDVMTLLIDTGADVNLPDGDGDTPLHWAAHAGRDGAARLLLQREADRGARNRMGWTALLWTAARNHPATAEVLLAAGLQVEAAGHQGRTSLYLAAGNGHVEVVKVLLRHGAAVNAADNGGDTPLHAAAWNGQQEVVDLLLAAGARTDVRNDAGATPFTNAVRIGRHHIAARLGHRAADPAPAQDSVHSVPADTAGAPPLSDLRITILYDNYEHGEGTRTDWGFACLIEAGDKNILFDTGRQPDILLHNVGELRLDLADVDMIVISHNHGDHTGGLLRVLEEVTGIPVYLPHSAPYDLVRGVERAGGSVVPVREPLQICPGIHLTGEMGDEIREQSLVADVAGGPVVVTGCAHPGIELIVERAVEISGRDTVQLVVGGFHLMRHSRDQLQAIVDRLRQAGVATCSPTHCTGDDAIDFFMSAFGKGYLPAGTGRVFRLGKDSGSLRGDDSNTAPGSRNPAPDP